MLENLALSESGFLFDALTGATYTLSPTGAVVLKALIDGADVDTAVTELARRCEIDRGMVARDVSLFVAHLVELGLVPGDDRDAEVGR